MKREYYPSFMAGLEEGDKRKFCMWCIPAELQTLDYGVQCAVGTGFARQLLDMYAIEGHTPQSDNYLPSIVQAMGVELDGVKVGFFSEIASVLVRHALRDERPMAA